MNKLRVMIQNIFSTLQYILSIVALSRDAAAIYIYHILYGAVLIQLFVPLIPYTLYLSRSLIKPTILTRCLMIKRRNVKPFIKLMQPNSLKRSKNSYRQTTNARQLKKVTPRKARLPRLENKYLFLN